jgi:hypothetical protein
VFTLRQWKLRYNRVITQVKDPLMRSWKLITALAAVSLTPLLLGASHTDSAVDAQQLYDSRFPAFYDEDANEVYWYYSLKGDCDQNGVVTIGDLSRLGNYLGSTVTAADQDKAIAAADCDGNGEVNINDLSAMGPNLNKQLVRYRVWVRPDYAPDYPFDSDTVVPAQDAIQDYANSTGVPVQDHLRYAIDTTGFESQWLWVQEELGQGELGRLSRLKMSSGTTNTAINTYDPNWGLNWNDGTDTLSFYHTMRGDYDQNGEVNVADLTPLFASMGSVGPWTIGDRKWAYDGNRDQQISPADSLIIGLLFGQNVGSLTGGFNVYYLPDIADMPSPYPPDLGILAAHVDVSEGLVLDQRRSYTVQLTGAAALGNNYLWVRPVSDDGELGARSEVLDTP